MLEQKIEELTRVVVQLTQAIKEQGTITTTGALPDAAKAQVTDDLFGDTAAADVKEVTIDDIRTQLKVFLDKGSPDDAKKVLAKYDATNLSGLKPEQYADFLKEIS